MPRNGNLSEEYLAHNWSDWKRYLQWTWIWFQSDFIRFLSGIWGSARKSILCLILSHFIYLHQVCSRECFLHQNNDIGTWIPRNLYREIPGRRQSQLGMVRIACISGFSDKQFGNCLQPALRVSLWILWALRPSTLFSFSELEAITRDHPAWLKLQQTAFPFGRYYD